MPTRKDDPALARPFRILSIDGGGIRGLIPALLLAELERRTGRPLRQVFDLFAGTGSGALMALTLAMPEPAPAAEALTRLFEAHCGRIFHHSLLDELQNPGGGFDEHYAAQGLEEVLAELFGETRLSGCTPEVLVTAYDLEKRHPFLFRSRCARLDPRHDYPLRTVARAACAAPTYFEPVRIPWPERYEQDVLVDGSCYASNPALCAFVEHLALAREGQAPPEVLLVSLGTGRPARALPFDEARDWGPADWTRHLMELGADGVADTVDHQLRMLLPPGEKGTPRYYRFQVGLDQDLDGLDNIAPANLEGLQRMGRRLLVAADRELDGLATRLLSTT